MKYTVDSEMRKVSTELHSSDTQAYYNVPLAKAILRNRPQKRIVAGDDQAVTVSFEFVQSSNTPLAHFTLQRDQLTDEQLIGEIRSKAQEYLSSEMTRIKELHESLKTVKEAFPND